MALYALYGIIVALLVKYDSSVAINNCSVHVCDTSWRQDIHILNNKLHITSKSLYING